MSCNKKAYTKKRFRVQHCLDTLLKSGPEKETEEYIKQVSRTIVTYGGKTLVASHDHTPLEGAPAQIVVVVMFDNCEKACEWYHSDDYQQIIDLRKNSSEGWVTLCNEFIVPFKGESQ